MKFKFYNVLENKTKIIKPTKGECVHGIIRRYYGSSFNYEVLVKETNKKFYVANDQDYTLKNISDVTVFLSPKGSEGGNAILSIIATAAISVALPGVGLGIAIARGLIAIGVNYAINKYLPIHQEEEEVEPPSQFFARTNRQRPLARVPQFYGEGVFYPYEVAPNNTQIDRVTYESSDNETTKVQESREFNNYRQIFTLGKGNLYIDSINGGEGLRATKRKLTFRHSRYSNTRANGGLLNSRKDRGADVGVYKSNFEVERQFSVTQNTFENNLFDISTKIKSDNTEGDRPDGTDVKPSSSGLTMATYTNTLFNDNVDLIIKSNSFIRASTASSGRYTGRTFGTYEELLSWYNDTQSATNGVGVFGTGSKLATPDIQITRLNNGQLSYNLVFQGILNNSNIYLLNVLEEGLVALKRVSRNSQDQYSSTIANNDFYNIHSQLINEPGIYGVITGSQGAVPANFDQYTSRFRENQFAIKTSYQRNEDSSIVFPKTPFVDYKVLEDEDPGNKYPVIAIRIKKEYFQNIYGNSRHKVALIKQLYHRNNFGQFFIRGFFAESVAFNRDISQAHPEDDNIVISQQAITEKAKQQTSGTFFSVRNRINVPTNIPSNYSDTFPSSIIYGLANFESNQHRNPAYIVLDMLSEAIKYKKINITNTTGKNIDFVAFKKWADFCHTNNFFIGKLFTKNQNLQESINEISQMGFGKVILLEGKYSVLIEQPKNFASLVISPTNARNFNFTLDASKDYHSVKLTYLTAGGVVDFAEVNSYFPGFTENNSTNFLKYNFEIYLSATHAQKMADYFLKSLRFRNETLTCEMDLASLTVSPGQLVLVGGMDIVNKKILSTLITKTSNESGANITNLSLSNSLNLVPGETYKITVRRLNGEIINLDVPFVITQIGDGTTTLEELTIGDEEVTINSETILIKSTGEPSGNTSNIKIITLSGFTFYENDLLFIKADNQDLKKYIVESVIPKDDISASISLLEYNTDVYEDT